MGQAHGQSEDIVEQPMVEDGAEEGSGGQHRIDWTERPILDASANVAGEQIVADSILLLKNM